MINFIIALFFIGILIASIQDLVKREVDNYVNFFLLASGFGFLIFSAVVEWNIWILIFGLLSFGVMFGLANLFYYGRVFAGGDAKLMIAMFALFASGSLFGTLGNIGIFILFLLLSGAVYGLFLGGILFFRNYSYSKKQFKKEFYNKYLRYFLFAGIVFFVLSYLDILFLFFSFLFFAFPVLFAFAKSVEKTAMIRYIDSRELRAGDWLDETIKIKGKTIKPYWEGLMPEEVSLLKKLKRKVRIREGIAFVPAFFIAFVLYIFKDYFLGLLRF